MQFQSYQSRQINPDRPLVTPTTAELPGFNRINPNRSIPTTHMSTKAEPMTIVSIVSIKTDQSRRYPRVAGRGAALRGRMAEPVF